MELSILIVTAQLTDSYIRWLAFSSKVSYEVKRRLWITYFIWGVASFFVYNWIFSVFSISATTYKAILMLGWLPYFIIGTRLIPLGMSQHVFVLGMAMICAVVQHTVCAITILNSFVLKTDAEIILFKAAVYLLLFALFLPICGRCFVKLLPSREFFNQRTIGIYIAVFPLIIVSGHLIRLADGLLIHSLAERISRIYLPVAFFFFYRYIILLTNNFYAMKQIKRNQERLEAQLFALKEYNALIRENQKKVSVMRHDLRHSYNLIYAMLESGNVAKAHEHIITQEFLLEATDFRTFCKSQMINVALNVSLRLAESEGIQVFTKINLPDKLAIDELDFALLLSNILSNAIKGSLQQEKSSRELSIIIQYENGQYVLEISFNLNVVLPLDEDGLPLNLEEHRKKDVLRSFISKYNALADISQRDGKVNLILYWNDHA